MFRWYWLFYALILIAGRFSLLLSLYCLKTPFGGAFVDRIDKFLWHTLYVESGVCMALATCFYAISFFVRGKGVWVLKIVSIVLGALYLILAGTDDEIMRWMSQKLSLSFISTYILAFSDTELASNIFWGDAFHFLLTVGIVVFFSAILVFFTVKKKQTVFFAAPYKKNILSLSVMLVLAVVGCTSFWWYNPVSRRQVRIKPVIYSFTDNVLEILKTRNPPANYNEGIVALRGDPNAEYPFWKEAKNEPAAQEAFKSKSLDEKPDIILFTIESLRGWTNDMRVKENCDRAPHLCELSKNSLYFPYAYSVGSPSIEGLLGIMEGVLSLPHHVLLNSYPNTRMRSISEILRDFDYHTEVLIGSDPYFDNGMVWFQKWFDYVEYKPENHSDVAMAHRFIEHYNSRPKGKPLFYHWMSCSMHIPFDLPKDMGEKPEDLDEAYLRSVAYMDSALGLIMDEVAKGERASNTIYILTGDHSLPSSDQMPTVERVGQASDAFTWVSLLFSGPGITPKIDTRPVSQGDIAPSIIGYLGLDASNHFMGTNLLRCKGADSSCNLDLPPVYSFRSGDMGLRNDSLTFLLPNVEGKDLALVLKKEHEPTWDVSNPVEGYVNEPPIEINREEKVKATETMRAISDTWKYLVYRNKLMPPK